MGSGGLGWAEEAPCQTPQPLCHLMVGLANGTEASGLPQHKGARAPWEKLGLTKPLVPVLAESAPTTALQISMKTGCLLISGYLPKSETFPISSAGVKGKANKKTKRQNLPTF